MAKCNKIASLTIKVMEVTLIKFNTPNVVEIITVNI